jgi:hypothetical protein
MEIVESFLSDITASLKLIPCLGHCFLAALLNHPCIVLGSAALP